MRDGGCRHRRPRVGGPRRHRSAVPVSPRRHTDWGPAARPDTPGDQRRRRAFGYAILDRTQRSPRGRHRHPDLGAAGGQGRARLRVGWVLDAVALGFPNRRVSERGRRDPEGSQGPHPQHRPERRHSRPEGRHPRGADAHLRRLQNASVGGRLRGETPAHRDGRPHGSRRAVRGHRREGKHDQTEGPTRSTHEADPETPGGRHPATAGSPRRQHSQGDVPHLRGARAGGPGANHHERTARRRADGAGMQ